MKKYSIGYTTGVFDLFHVGHLNILQRAKDYCENLIVGVSTDEVVFNYKKNPPIIPFEERVRIVEAIKYVDRVVPQISMDKMRAWEDLRFNAMFHGDDWRGSAMYNEVESRLGSVGVSVVYIPYTKGTSSTMIKNILTSLPKGEG